MSIRTSVRMYHFSGADLVFMNSRIQHPIIETAAHMKDKVAKYMSAEDVKSRISQVTDKIASMDALEIAKKAGNPLTENIVMLGAVSTLEVFPIPEDALKKAVADNVPKKAVDVNLRAFDLGKKASYDTLCKITKCRE